jgi:hypothetical protein
MDGPLGSAPEAAWGRSSAAGLTASLEAVSSTPPQEFPEHPDGGTVSIRHHNSRRLSEASRLRNSGLTINAKATKGGSARQESTSIARELRRDLLVPSFGWRYYHFPEHSSQR